MTRSFENRLSSVEQLARANSRPIETVAMSAQERAACDAQFRDFLDERPPEGWEPFPPGVDIVEEYLSFVRQGQPQ